MAGFTIICNNCGNKIVTGDDFEAINGKIDVELGENYIIEDDETFPFTFLFCWKCSNNTNFK